MPTESQLLSLILGPLGALALALIVVVGLVKVIQALARDHLKADQDDRTQRDAAFVDLRAQSAATNRVADSYAAIAKEIATLTVAVGVIANRVTAIERSMARRRKDDP